IFPYSKNGEYLGVAFNIPEDMNKPFFPQISVKNAKIRVNFGLSHPIFPLMDDNDFYFLSDIPKEFYVPSIIFNNENARFDIIYMSGLPLSGKT
ncbi:hypothetical protein, partial [Salmonella sp. s51228]|uniref:hypothetical protein n=1 Tax=Salmonella sp. s51228 TaxID=3159652 RepID=UPI00397F6EC1